MDTQNFIHGKEKGEVVGLELGSVYVIPKFRGCGVAKELIDSLLSKLNTIEELRDVSVFAVVTKDNEPSNRLFEKYPRFEKQELTSEETDNFTRFFINGVNIFENWELPSNIYWLKRD